MNEKLQKIYYYIGIIQRLSMLLLTIIMIVASYKIYSLSVKTLEIINQYGIDIKQIQDLVESIHTMLEKSWFF